MKFTRSYLTLQSLCEAEIINFSQLSCIPLQKKYNELSKIIADNEEECKKKFQGTRQLSKDVQKAAGRCKFLYFHWFF